MLVDLFQKTVSILARGPQPLQEHVSGSSLDDKARDFSPGTSQLTTPVYGMYSTNTSKRKSCATGLINLVQDTRRFIMYHKGTIENSPLQIYASALLCSPARSQIRQLFR